MFTACSCGTQGHTDLWKSAVSVYFNDVTADHHIQVKDELLIGVWWPLRSVQLGLYFGQRCMAMYVYKWPLHKFNFLSWHLCWDERNIQVMQKKSDTVTILWKLRAHKNGQLGSLWNEFWSCREPCGTTSLSWLQYACSYALLHLLYGRCGSLIIHTCQQIFTDLRTINQKMSTSIR